MVGYIVSCALDQFQLFSLIDRSGWSAITGIPSRADLDEDDRVLVLHDQIDFPQSAAIIALDQFQPLLFQVPQRQIFCPLAGVSCLRAGAEGGHQIGAWSQHQKRRQ